VETTISPDQVRSSRSIETQMNLDIDPAVLGIATLDLALARSDALIDLIQRSETNGVDAEEARLVLWSRLARTLAVVLGPLLGLSFLFGPLRSSGAGANILVGAGIGLMLFTLQGIATSLARLDGGPLPALTLLPPALMGAIAVAMLSRTG
jgi:lipopolysaccharide export system permease protein